MIDSPADSEPDVDVDLDDLPTYAAAKRRIVVTLVIYAACIPVVVVIVGLVPELLMSLIAFNIGMLWWAYYDSLEFGRRLARGWRLGLLLTGGIAFAAYLVSTRGGRRGMISIGKSFLLLLLIASLQFIVICVLASS